MRATFPGWKYNLLATGMSAEEIQRDSGQESRAHRDQGAVRDIEARWADLCNTRSPNK